MSAPPESYSSLPLPTSQLPKTSRKFATTRTIFALILREMSSRYGRSPGGYIWAILEPLGGIMILGFAFSLIMRTPPLGNSFILFFATGYLPFNLYRTLERATAKGLSYSKALLAYPAVTWADAILARFLLNSLTGIFVTYLLLAGILATQDTRVTLDALPILGAISMVLLLGLGLGTLNCALGGKIAAWDQIWSIASRPLFLASGVFFLYDDMPKAAQDILWYNPLIHVISYLRTGFYPTYHPDYISIPYVVTFGLILLALGVVLVGRYHRDILND
ncbi:MAG: sugar ABC transporter permease [Rhodobacteraceae bacterium]|nr:sugar ABC transporter permease [Paracoccaceae bacterium]